VSRGVKSSSVAVTLLSVPMRRPSSTEEILTSSAGAIATSLPAVDSELFLQPALARTAAPATKDMSRRRAIMCATLIQVCG
jgi:hypothetical protein